MSPHVLHGDVAEWTFSRLTSNLEKLSDHNECSKKKVGGEAMFVKERWCNPGHISVKD